MKRTLSLILALLTILSCVVWMTPASAADSPTSYYVAIDGDDQTGTGESDAPFASLAHALEVIKQNKASLPEGKVTVYLRSGRYSFTESLVIEANTVSDARNPLHIVALEGEEVIFDGGKILEKEGFVSLQDDITARMNKDVASKVLVYDLKGAGIDTDKAWEDPDDGILQLLVNGAIMPIAREPDSDKGFYKLGEKTEDAKDENGTNISAFQDDGTFAVLKGLESVRIHGYLSVDYFSEDARVLSYENGEVRLGCFANAGTPFFLYNSPELLTSPGEYFIDKNTGKLYVYPTADFADSTVSVTQLETPVLDVRGGEYITVEGITFTGTVANAVHIQGNDIRFANNVIEGVGGIALEISGLRNRVEKNLICEIGSTGISFAGGSFETLTASESAVCNNKIFHYAKNGYTYRPGVAVNEQSYQLTVCHNEIAYSIHNGILGGCYDGLVEYNYIHDVCTEASDAGALYTGGWHSQNYTIRYNIFREVRNLYFFGIPSAIYVDDGGSNKNIYGNIVDGCGGRGILIGGGHNIQIYNNMLLDIEFGPLCYDERQYYERDQYPNTVFPGNNWGLTDNVQYATEAFTMLYMRFTYMRMTNEFDPIDRHAHGSVGYSRYRGNVGVLLEEGRTGEVDAFTKKFLIEADNPEYLSREEAGIDENYQLIPGSAAYQAIPYWKQIPVDQIGTFGW